MSEPVGYKMINGILEIDPDEAKFVSFIYAQREKYSVTPPVELVEEIFQRESALDAAYTRDMAVEAAKSSPRIDDFIAEDVNREFSKELIARVNRKIEDSKQPSYRPNSELKKGQIAHTRIESIIDRATYEAVQAKLKETK